MCAIFAGRAVARRARMPNLKILFASTLLVGCGTSVSTLQLRPLTNAPRPPLSVEMFTVPPARPYIEVARIEAHDLMAPSASYMMSKIRERGASMGCDGIVLDPIGHHEDPHHLTDHAGMCIMFAAQTTVVNPQAPSP